ncbi:hypothetical protein HZY83_02395 [Gemella sp. GH3]|uniref:hypothetical protein n=1 Tax=unclassified Gemella TaxID=2624949 RepID=UPI0015CFF02C|nr:MULTISPECIES: hypothetical protein [unclassified Gemella]MBF0713536.1 hypothetical protein [Gemella sp. GH3.1]NYS50488.1 hypothetical protein [Gemella sp. GH3]
MNKKLKLASALLATSLVVTPISGVIYQSSSVAKAETIQKDKIDLNSFDTVKDLSREELIASFAKDRNISNYEAEKELFKNNISFRKAYYYREYLRNIGHSTYIKLYCQGDGWDNYFSVDKILNVSVIPNNKVFVGSVYYNLENNYTVYYEVNGNLYNNATISISGGGSVGVGSAGSLNISASYTTNHYAQLYKSERWIL